MKYLQLLLVYWCANLFAGANYTGAPVVIDGYACVNDYWSTIACVLNITGDPGGRTETNYWLKFNWDKGEFTCPLVRLDHSYSCTVTVPDGPAGSSNTFTSMDSFHIDLYYESGSHTLNEDFDPSDNIQLTAPHDVVVQCTSDVFNITWKSGYEHHRYLKKSQLQYELSLQNTNNKVSRLFSETTSTSFGRSELELDMTYCIKVKSLPLRLDEYGGIWSKWSPLTCCRTEASKEQETLIPMLVKYVGPVCVVVGVLLFVLYNPATRMKIKTLSHVPSPAPFFQPLFQDYKGNLQEWLSSQGNAILTYKTEELLTTDTLIVVPAPVTKDQEDRDPQDTLVKLPISIQCPTSYVSLPGMQLTAIPFPSLNGNQGDTSYTRLPCSALQFSFGEVAVVTSLPEDFVDISRDDSSCGCEDLTQSPECSSPISPLRTHPQCFCDDYCILNKTAEGFTPILLQKGSILNVPPVY